MAWTAPRTWVTAEVVTAAQMNAHVRDNFLAGLGPAATTVSALNTAWGGTPPDGAPGALRVGSSPYDFVALKYDTTLGKWVSAPTRVNWGANYSINHNTTVSEVSSQTELLAPDYDVYRTAGLSMQYRALWRWLNQSGSNGNCRLYLLGQSEGGATTSPAQQFDLNAALSTDARYTSHCDLQPNDWRGVPTTWDGYDALLAYWAVTSNASPGTTTTVISNMCVVWRWVS